MSNPQTEAYIEAKAEQAEENQYFTDRDHVMKAYANLEQVAMDLDHIKLETNAWEQEANHALKHLMEAMEELEKGFDL